MTREEALWIMQMCRDRDARSEAEKEAYNTAIVALEKATINCVHCSRYYETEDEKGVHSHCRAVEREQVSFENDTETKSYSKDSGDLTIKGAEGIKDGLYVIKDGTLFKYKEKGGTVRVYTIADRPKGEWNDIGGVIRWGCSLCHYAYDQKFNFCPNCGADMRGDGK